MVLYHLKGLDLKEIEKKSLLDTEVTLDIKEFERKQKVWEEFSKKTYYLIPEIVKTKIYYNDKYHLDMLD